MEHLGLCLRVGLHLRGLGSLLLHLASLVLGQERLVGRLTSSTTRPHLEAWLGDDQTRWDPGEAARRRLLEASAIAAIATMTARLGTFAAVAAIAAGVVLLRSATARNPGASTRVICCGEAVRMGPGDWQSSRSC
jgi:hypothetical protein